MSGLQPETAATTSVAANSVSIEDPLQSSASGQPAPNTTSAPASAEQAHPPDTEALGPAADATIAPPSPSAAGDIHGSALRITLMLTTGARHPYRIDEKYLLSRKVSSATDAAGRFDPREISAYKLKELIWTDWRSEWEPRPSSPSSIRLICMGRMLEDKSPLKDFPFKLDDNNVLHMTVKPADFLDDDETTAGAAKGHQALRARDGGDGGAGCRCVIL